MKLSSPIKISYKNLMAAKFRSFLTILGIIIGIASVIIVMAVGASAQKLILDQVNGVGSNLIGVLPGASNDKGPPAAVFGIVTTTLKQADIDAVLKKKNVSNALAASGYVSGVGTMTYESTSVTNSFQGVSADLPNVENIKLQAGRFFSNEENIGLARVAVLGATAAEDIFKNQDPLGKVFTLKNVNLVVIGVIEKKGSGGISNTDGTVYVPLLTAQKLLLGIDYLNFMRVKIDAIDNMERATADIAYTIRARHNIKDPANDDFSVRNTAQALSTITNVTNILKYFLTGIAAISLLVGGVGVMNIMLISVNQRVREVGLRRAVGARSRHIMTQFLIESAFITLTGGVVGIILGMLVALLAAVVIRTMGFSWQFLISPSSIIVATMVSVAIGVLFGIYPARKAARISPTEALRYE
jgi:putative ABC transport system permease protein